MAGAPAAPAVGGAPEPATRRAVLRRTRGHTGTAAFQGAAQRRQSPSDQFLPLARSGVDDHDGDEERIGGLLRVAPPLQRIAAGGGSRHGGSGLAVLLPESHRLQRPVPLQSPGPLQRPVRPLQEDRLSHRLHRGAAGVLAVSSSPLPISSSSRCAPTISSTPTRPTMSSSPTTRPAGSDGTNRRAPPNGCRSIPVRWCSPINEPGGSRSCTGNSASPSPSRPPLVISAAPATGRRRRRCSPRAISNQDWEPFGMTQTGSRADETDGGVRFRRTCAGFARPESTRDFQLMNRAWSWATLRARSTDTRALFIRTSCPPSGGPVTVRLKPDTTTQYR